MYYYMKKFAIVSIIIMSFIVKKVYNYNIDDKYIIDCMRSE